MQTAFHILKAEGHANELTQEVISAAMEIYNKEYYNF
jgi:hypothetical protein